MKKLSTAYLVVHCNSKTNEIKNVQINSCPPWIQSIVNYETVSYVALEMQGESFRKAFDNIINHIKYMKDYEEYFLKIFHFLNKNIPLEKVKK